MFTVTNITTHVTNAEQRIGLNEYTEHTRFIHCVVRHK